MPPLAVEKARRLGFDCHNFKPKLLCRLLGRHVNVSVSQKAHNPCDWTLHAHCCAIVGFHNEPRPVMAKAPELWTAQDEANERRLYESNRLAFWLCPTRDLATLTFEEDTPMKAIDILAALSGGRARPSTPRDVAVAGVQFVHRGPPRRAVVVANVDDAIKGLKP